jgi:drug/metabolite transporter (DMT)-like permease
MHPRDTQEAVATFDAKRRLPASTIGGLLLLVLIWAFCFPLIEVGLVSAPDLRFAALRAFLAGVLLVAISWLLRRPFPSGPRTWLKLAGIGLSLTALGFGGMFLAGGRVSPGLATVVANAQPLVAALLGYLVLGEHLRGLRGLALGGSEAGSPGRYPEMMRAHHAASIQPPYRQPAKEICL